MPDLTPESVTNRPSRARQHAMAASVSTARREPSPAAVWIGLAVLFAVSLWALSCAPLPLMSTDYSRAPGRGAAHSGLVPANTAVSPARCSSEAPVHTRISPARLIGPRAGDLFVLSVYAPRYAGRLTASGLPYRPSWPICASNRHPLGTILLISWGDRQAVAMVVDRLAIDHSDRIDLSESVWADLAGGAAPGLLHLATVEEVAR